MTFFGAFDNFGWHAPSAGAAAIAPPPAGATGWLKLDDAAAGAFPTVANQGSVSDNWTRNGSAITVETASGPPSAMKFAYSSASADYLKLGTKAMSTLLAATAGMIGIIFRITPSGTNAIHLLNHDLFKDSASLVGIGTHATAPNISPSCRGGSENNQVAMAYTAGTWRALVMRYERGSVNKLFGKLDGDVSWSEDAITQDIFSLTGTVQVLGASSTVTAACAELLTYQTQSEANGDLLLDYLTARAGL